ncbi:MAG TPA: biotin--[acetyl-CoA-carboxylase] ligase [Tepidisphaeraceae bacterium]|nr:biotin--[acetyl-CoA-carboxylase] ligase [Tepidisphaeraceae bacterium]
MREGLKPLRLHWYPRLRSTNDHAAVLRRRGRIFAPCVVLTGKQTAGRGRGSNSWWSGSGNLTVTFVLAQEDYLPPHEIPLIAGLSVRDAAAELTGERNIELKWPNDVLFDGKKLAGILCERVTKADLVGIGLNVNLDPAKAPPALRPSVTSLLAIRANRQPLDLTDVLIRVAQHLHANVRRRANQPFVTFLRQYERHHALVGKRVAIAGEAISGRVEGIDRDGRLVLTDRGVTHRVVAGTVIIPP